MAIAPFSQVPTQPNFTPRSGARPVGLVAACLGHQRGGGGKEPRSCSCREKSSPSCRAGLPGPSHPPSGGLGLPTSEMGQHAHPTDSVKCTYHLPALPHLLLSLAYNNSETQVELPLCYTREQSSGRGSHSLQGADRMGAQEPAANSWSFPVRKQAAWELPEPNRLPTADIINRSQSLLGNPDLAWKSFSTHRSRQTFIIGQSWQPG